MTLYPLPILNLSSLSCYFTHSTGGELYNLFFPDILSPRTTYYQLCLWHVEFYMFIHWRHFQWLPCSPTHLLCFSVTAKTTLSLSKLMKSLATGSDSLTMEQVFKVRFHTQIPITENYETLSPSLSGFELIINRWSFTECWVYSNTAQNIHATDVKPWRKGRQS